MKSFDNRFSEIQQSPAYRRYYIYACFGFALIGLTYLSRPLLSYRDETLSLALGIMPSLAGSFATPYIFLIWMAIRRGNKSLIGNGLVFSLINLFVLGICMLIEFLHQWLDLGGFHWNDILASVAGVLMALLSFRVTRG